MRRSPAARARYICELTRSDAGSLSSSKKLGQSEDADAVAVVAPSVIEHVRLRAAGRKLGARPFAEREPFEIEADIDRQAFALRPVVNRRSVIGE